jgi:hypothetical protein
MLPWQGKARARDADPSKDNEPFAQASLVLRLTDPPEIVAEGRKT